MKNSGTPLESMAYVLKGWPDAVAGETIILDKTIELFILFMVSNKKAYHGSFIISILFL